MTTVKIKSGDWEVEVSTKHDYTYASDIVNFLTASIDSAVKNYVEPKTTIKQSDLDIKDNQIMLLKEDLEVVHMYLDEVEVKRKDDNGETYSIVGRIRQYQRDMIERLSNLESAFIKEQCMMYSEEEVEKILESQRGNCYVSVFNKTKDDDIAILTITSPEPGDWKKSERDFGFG